MTNNSPVRVDIAQPVIKKLKKLLKKYPHVVQDLQAHLTQFINIFCLNSGLKPTAFKRVLRNISYKV